MRNPGRDRYEAFGLSVASAWPLSQLSPVEGQSAESDVTVETGALPQRPGGVTRDSTTIHADDDRGFTTLRTPDALYWFYERVGTLRIREGRDVVVDPAPAASRAAVERLLLGPGMQSVLVQREHLVLHASAVVIGDSLVAVAGPSGRGKSTVAAACSAAGHVVHADDTVAIDSGDGGPCVPPGVPSLGVAPVVANSLSLAGDEVEGRIAVDDDRFSDEARRIDRVYLLADDEAFGVDPLPNGAAVFALLRASYSLYDDTNADRAASHLSACGALADTVTIRRLRRPRSLDRLPELVRLLERGLSD